MKFYVKLIVAVVIMYIVFAVFPDSLNISFMPTGGWDWLSFAGVVISVVIAYQGISDTIAHEGLLIRTEAQLNSIPCLDVRAQPNYTTGHLTYFRVLTDRENKLVNNGFKLTDTSKVPERFNPSTNIVIRNVGLSTAMGVEVIMHKVTSIKGLDNIDDYLDEKDVLIAKNLFDKATVENHRYFDEESLRDNEFMIINPINIPNNSEFTVVLSFDSRVKNAYHNIIEYRFSDIHNNHYYQLQYIYFTGSTTVAETSSRVFRGDSWS